MSETRVAQREIVSKGSSLVFNVHEPGSDVSGAGSQLLNFHSDWNFLPPASPELLHRTENLQDVCKQTMVSGVEEPVLVEGEMLCRPVCVAQVRQSEPHREAIHKRKRDKEPGKSNRVACISGATAIEEGSLEKASTSTRKRSASDHMKSARSKRARSNKAPSISTGG